MMLVVFGFYNHDLIRLDIFYNQNNYKLMI